MEDKFVTYNNDFIPEYQLVKFMRRYLKENPHATKVALVKEVRHHFKTSLAYAHSQVMEALKNYFPQEYGGIETNDRF